MATAPGMAPTSTRYTGCSAWRSRPAPAGSRRLSESAKKINTSGVRVQAERLGELRSAMAAGFDATEVVELGDVVRVTREPASYPIFRRNGRYAEMVTGELAGRYEAPIYGMLEVADRLAANEATAGIVERFHGQPEDESKTQQIDEEELIQPPMKHS